MLKKLIYIKYSVYILCITTSCSYTQNIVPNYSFEDTLHCPFNPGQVLFAPPWYDPTGASSDYFNSCGNSIGIWGVPSNISGYQYAKTGNAYVGIATFYNGSNHREYIQTKLSYTLNSGKNYCVEFYVSLSDTQTVACNNIGAYFSDTAITGLMGAVINVIPQINNDITNHLTNKIGWTKVSGSFIATGAENYITIGNFLDDAGSDTIHYSDVLPGSYYYIDDVSVICCDCDAELTAPNVFTPNNDGVNDVFKIKAENVVTLNCKLYNRWGLLVAELKAPNEVWDGKTTSGMPASDGVYYYIIEATDKDNKQSTKTGYVQLLR